MTITITIDQAEQWTCWSREQLLKVSGGRTEMTAMEVCDLDTVGIPDRMFLLLRPEIIPAPQLRLLACHWAEQTLIHERDAGREPDPRSWEAIGVARRYAHGDATDEELAAARAAAWAAVWNAARDAARVAAWRDARAARVAAWAAARAAASDAARDAARAAARAAASDAAWAAWDAVRDASAAWDAAWDAASDARDARAAAWSAMLECVRVMLRWLEEQS